MCPHSPSHPTITRQCEPSSFLSGKRGPCAVPLGQEGPWPAGLHVYCSWACPGPPLPALAPGEGTPCQWWARLAEVMPVGAISLWLCLPGSQQQVLTSPGVLGPAALQGILLAQLPCQTGAQHQLPQRLSCCRPTGCWMGGQVPVVRLDLGVLPAAAPSPWAAMPSFLQGHPCREARLVPLARAALLDPTLFQGVCWHVGSGRARMPVGLLGSMAGWPLSKCDGVGTVPTGGWSPSLPTSPLPSPRLLLVGWSSCGWGGDAAASCPTSALPLTLLSLGFIPGSWKQQWVGRAGAGPPLASPHGGGPASTPAQRQHNAEPPLPPRPSAQCL